jgi:hypothetical protein
MRPFVFLTLLVFAWLPSGAVAGETIRVGGMEYRNAEMVELCREGLIYKTEEGSYVTLPWATVSAPQLSAARTKMGASFENALYDAHFVKGTVFQKRSDGVVIQVEIPEEHKAIGYKNGAKVLESGLVIVRDLPTSLPQEEGAAVEIVAHKRGTFTYDLGIAAKEIPLLTVAKPLWGMEQEWKNQEGKAMVAKLVAVKDTKGMFEKGGKRFIYDLTQLDADGRKRAADIAEKLAGFPLP